MTGTASQIEWAEIIRPQVGAEFDRVAGALEQVARGQDESSRTETRAIIAILEEKRAEVMANEHAGYFIRGWGERSDQVRQMISRDSRWQAIQAARRERRQSLTGATQL